MFSPRGLVILSLLPDSGMTFGTSYSVTLTASMSLLLAYNILQLHSSLFVVKYFDFIVWLPIIMVEELSG